MTTKIKRKLKININNWYSCVTRSHALHYNFTPLYSGFQLTLAARVAKFVGKFGTMLLKIANYIYQLANQIANFVLNYVISAFGKLKRHCNSVFEYKTILNIYLNGKSDQRTKGNVQHALTSKIIVYV